MGIRYLTKRLADYSKRCVLGSTAKGASSIAIIDGPGLAYHIFYTAVKTPSLGGAEPSTDVTYASIVKATTSWLFEAQSVGFDLHAIFFDGALPPSKRDERLQRLRDHRNALDARRKRSLSGLDMMRESPAQALPPPFLVPAVVEALVNSKALASEVYVVPGEADAFCAVAARAHPCDAADSVTIFSDDSDLIVYPATEKTRVVPFRDISVFRTLDETVWSGTEIWPRALAQRFGDSELGLIKPAFLMSLQQTLSLERACVNVRASDPAGSRATAGAYTSFAQTFALEDASKQWAEMQQSGSSNQSVQALDTRILELVRSMKSVSPRQPASEHEIFLPLLIDDPSRRSAWAVADNLRNLAYSIALTAGGPEVRMKEYRRSGAEDKIAAIDIKLYTHEEIEAHIKKLTSSLQTTFALQEGRKRRVDAWRRVCMQHVIDCIHSRGADVPELEQIMTIWMGHAKAFTWDTIHLYAQYQAAYYSYRMLKQLLQFAGADSRAGRSQCWRDLQACLEDLPTIPDLFEPMNSKDAAKLKIQIQKDLPSVAGKVNGPRLSRATVKKTSRMQEAQSQQRVIKHASKNPFALLSGG